MCGVDPGLSPWGNTKGEVGDVSDCVGTFGSSVPKGLCAMAMIDRVPHLLGYPIGMRICGPHIELTLTRCMGSGITLRLTCITVPRPVLFIFARSIAAVRLLASRGTRVAARRRLRPLRRLPAFPGAPPPRPAAPAARLVRARMAGGGVLEWGDCRCPP
jgi:hypothetical protein